MKLGIAYVPTLPPERLRELATVAENSGLDELWVWEDCFKQSAIASAAAALAMTSTIPVGIGLLPAPLRNVALTAMEFATLERMFPGRLIAGVGHGVQDWMRQVGAQVASPLTLLEEYTTALRRLLAGEQVTVDGRYVQLDAVQLDWPPVVPPPLVLGGAGPKTLSLAGRLGDGVLLGTALSDDVVRQSCATVAAARAGSGPDRTAPDSTATPITATQIVATGPGAQQRLDRELPFWDQSAGSGIGVAGDAAAVAASLRRWADAGITTVVIQPTRDEPDLPGLLRFLGQQVRPLL